MEAVLQSGPGSISATVRAVEAICSLPAVPTQDWCDRAAAALALIRQPSSVLLVVARLGQGAAPGTVEATGVAGTATAQVGTSVGRHHTESSTIVQVESNNPDLLALRSAVQSMGDIGWKSDALGAVPSAPPGVRVGTAGSIAGATTTPAFRQSPLSARWSAAGEVLLGVAPFGEPDSGRVLLAEIGFAAPEGPALSDDQAVLVAVLPLLARRAALAIGSDTSSPAHWLTPREELVLFHLLQGKSVRQIAAEIDRSPHTVHDHVKALHRKLGATSRGQLVARALGHLDASSKGADAAPTRNGQGDHAERRDETRQPSA